MHIDALSARVVLDPSRFDVIVGSNLFGDILSDLTAAVSGSLGVAPSANLDPTGEFPSMFEPVHGSAPDIAGQGIANPVAAVWSAAMMLEHLGHAEAAAHIMRAVEATLPDRSTRTRDLGGTATTEEAGAAIVKLFEKV
jgi:tartrate dehydrogenase/decarboxylase / D-malate dehydrogenase